ncbi:MAG: RHS repeat-associated core domain-containing protein [Bacteroidales bacterium]
MKVKSITYNELNNLCWEEGNLQQGFSDIGNGGLIEITNHVEELGHPFEELRTMQEEGIGETFYQCIGLGVTKQLPDLYNTVELFSNTQVNPDEPSFYYTTDHLGSSSYLTNDLGQTTQIIAYMPYGEDWVNRNFTQNFRSNYKYNGKEKDPESGYYNYGARYYGGNLPIWLSVDPLSDKYPHLTPYAYCAGNPIMLVDPDGREVVNVYEGQVKEAKEAMLKAENELNNFSGDKKSDEYKKLKSGHNDAKRDFKNKEMKKEKMNSVIEQVKKESPKYFEKMNTLKNNKGEEINIYLEFESLGKNGDFGYATTGNNYSTNKYGANSAKITINFDKYLKDQTLVHEFGHVEYNYSLSPKGYVDYRNMWGGDGHNKINGVLDPSGKNAEDRQRDYRTGKLN